MPIKNSAPRSHKLAIGSLMLICLVEPGKHFELCPRTDRSQKRWSASNGGGESVSPEGPRAGQVQPQGNESETGRGWRAKGKWQMILESIDDLC